MDRHADSVVSLSRAEVEQTIQARFEEVVRRVGDRLALTGNGRRWTYDALNRDANRLAHVMRARIGSATGPVACLLPHAPEMVIATLASLKAGRPYLALHTRMPPAAMAEIVLDASPSLLLTNRALAAQAAALANGRSDVLVMDEVGTQGPDDNPEDVAHPCDPATVFFTSGTTGRPKGVVRSHRVVVHRAWLTAEQEGIEPGDRRSLLTHCSFAASQADLAGALLLGTTLSVFDVVPEGLDAFASWIDEQQITILRPPVQLFRRLVASVEPDRQFRSARLVSLGGDAIVRADIDAWRRHFPRPATLIYRFSSTETTLLTSTRIDHDSDPAGEVMTVGRPVADRDVTLVDDDGRPVPAGETGELVVTSEFLADGYWRAPEETAARFTPDPVHPHRRSFRTGDVGHFLADGRFVFEGRRDQLVKIRGYRVNVREVEQAVRQVTGVRECAVVVVQNDEGHRLVAFVDAHEGAHVASSTLRQELGAHLPEWKVPARIHVLESLPSTANGKVDRLQLQDTAERLAATPEFSSSAGVLADPIEQTVADVVQRVLKCGPVDRSSDFFLLGGDSLQATVLHQRLERALGVRIPLQGLARDATVKGIAELVRRARFAGTSGRPPILVPLRETGSHVPLFFVHGRLGQAFVGPHFLEAFGRDQPVFAFQATGLDPSRMLATTIAEMAAEYVRALREVQPTGPYFLGGVCAGGLVVPEMASQLLAAGERVGPLLLIDPPVVPLAERARWRVALWLLRLRAQRALFGQTRGTFKEIRERARRGRVAIDPVNRDAVKAAAAAQLNFTIARLRYRDWQYGGPVLLLRSTRRLRRDGPTRRGVFSRHLTGDVRWFDVGGTHTDVRKEGNTRMAACLRDAVSIAQTALAALRDERSSDRSSGARASSA